MRRRAATPTTPRRRRGAAAPTPRSRRSLAPRAGMDTPDLPMEFVERAAAAARRGEAVVHDCADGGYVLVALPRDAPPAVFDDVRWSCAETAASQRAALARNGIVVAARSGPAWRDVDEADDVAALAARLAAAPGACPALDALRPRLEARLSRAPPPPGD